MTNVLGTCRAGSELVPHIACCGKNMSIPQNGKGEHGTAEFEAYLCVDHPLGPAQELPVRQINLSFRVEERGEREA